MKHVDLRLPGSRYSTWSDENIRDYVRHFAWTLYHPVGTCRMGSEHDPETVVDPYLRYLIIVIISLLCLMLTSIRYSSIEGSLVQLRAAIPAFQRTLSSMHITNTWEYK